MALETESFDVKELQFQRVCKALFDSAAEGLVVMDDTGKIIRLNGRATDMLGYNEDELIGATIETLVPTRYAHSHASRRDSYLESPARRSMGMGMDLAARRKDGSEIPVEISLNHFEIDGMQYVMALISDITKRKVAEHELENLNQDLERRVQERTRELAESRNLYATIARNFPNGIIMVFDRNYNYVFAEGRELFKMGVTSEQLVGTNYLERLAPTERETIEKHLSEVLNGKHVTFEMLVDDKQFELHGVPLRDPEGVVTQILLVETNVTAYKRAEQNMLKALEKERELNELKSRFVSMASHEFRTPLSTILTSLSLAVRYEGPENEGNRQKHYNRIKSSVYNLTGILNDFLSLDKLESGMIGCNPEPTQLDVLLQDICDEMQGICKDGQKINVKFAGDPKSTIDKNMVRNVVVNLISNAIKYSEEGKPIDVEVQVADGKIMASVRDHGIGIPEADQVHMFQRFFRAQNATNIQGTGLGLNIVKKYLDLMAGDIWFESTYRVGTVFKFVIPQHLQL